LELAVPAITNPAVPFRDPAGAPCSAVAPARHAALPCRDLFGAPPLIGGEDAAAYDDLVARVASTVAPADVLEEMWVRDVVDLAWETMRLRRLNALLITAAAPEGLVAALTPAIGAEPARELADRWAAGGRRAARRVDTLFAAIGLAREAVTAYTLALRIDDVERIDRMIMLTESRRAAALREIERHRAALAQALRQALEHDPEKLQTFRTRSCSKINEM
jgi:hypothetical protein